MKLVAQPTKYEGDVYFKELLPTLKRNPAVKEVLELMNEEPRARELLSIINDQ